MNRKESIFWSAAILVTGSLGFGVWLGVKLMGYIILGR